MFEANVKNMFYEKREPSYSKTRSKSYPRNSKKNFYRSFITLKCSYVNEEGLEVDCMVYADCPLRAFYQGIGITKARYDALYATLPDVVEIEKCSNVFGESFYKISDSSAAKWVMTAKEFCA